MKIMENILDIQTGEETLVERDETPDETKQRLEYETWITKRDAEQAAKESERKVILDKLGLTADEAKLLLG